MGMVVNRPARVVPCDPVLANDCNVFQRLLGLFPRKLVAGDYISLVEISNRMIRPIPFD